MSSRFEEMTIRRGAYCYPISDDHPASLEGEGLMTCDVCNEEPPAVAIANMYWAVRPRARDGPGYHSRIEFNVCKKCKDVVEDHPELSTCGRDWWDAMDVAVTIRELTPTMTLVNIPENTNASMVFTSEDAEGLLGPASTDLRLFLKEELSNNPHDIHRFMMVNTRDHKAQVLRVTMLPVSATSDETRYAVFGESNFGTNRPGFYNMSRTWYEHPSSKSEMVYACKELDTFVSFLQHMAHYSYVGWVWG
jgi:hypothetical protein